MPYLNFNPPSRLVESNMIFAFVKWTLFIKIILTFIKIFQFKRFLFQVCRVVRSQNISAAGVTTSNFLILWVAISATYTASPAREMATSWGLDSSEPQVFTTELSFDRSMVTPWCYIYINRVNGLLKVNKCDINYQKYTWMNIYWLTDLLNNFWKLLRITHTL